MTSKEAIKHLRTYSSTLGSGQTPQEQHEEAKRVAIENLEKTRWIPVSERLPKDGKTVIASVKGCIYPEARYVKGYGWEWAYESGADYWEELEDVIAWCELPKPYKEG